MNKNFIRAFVAIFIRMKKFATSLFIFSMVFCWVQSSNAQCVQCDTSSHATGENASVIGTNTLASGDESFAGGIDSEATGKQSFAFGDSAIASGNYSLSAGYKSNANGDYSMAFGRKASAMGDKSIALSLNSLALGRTSMALGPYTKTGEDALVSVAIGSRVTASTERSMAIGFGIPDYPVENDISYSLMMGFYSDRPTFFVSPSDGIGTTGKIGIGDVTDPQAKLHIREDENYDTASVYIQGFDEDRSAYLWLGTKNYGLKKFDNNLEFLTNDNYVFNDGELGIGTDDPQAKVHVKEGDIFIEDIDHGIVMKSPNGSCWKGTLTDDGQLQFAEVDCDDLMVSTPEPLATAQNTGIRIYPNPTGNRVFIEISAEWTGATLTIQNANGTDLSVQKMHNTNSFIDMTSFETGVYIFRITTADSQKVISEKVIKN